MRKLEIDYVNLATLEPGTLIRALVNERPAWAISIVDTVGTFSGAKLAVALENNPDGSNRPFIYNISHQILGFSYGSNFWFDVEEGIENSLLERFTGKYLQKEGTIVVGAEAPMMAVAVHQHMFWLNINNFELTQSITPRSGFSIPSWSLMREKRSGNIAENQTVLNWQCED